MNLEVDPEELSWLADGLMVLMHGIAEVPENDGSELPGMQALLNRMTGQLEPFTRPLDGTDQGPVPDPGELAWSELVTLGQELAVPAAGRTRDGCVISEDPDDVARVAAHQRGTDARPV